MNKRNLFFFSRLKVGDMWHCTSCVPLIEKRIDCICCCTSPSFPLLDYCWWGPSWLLPMQRNGNWVRSTWQPQIPPRWCKGEKEFRREQDMIGGDVHFSIGRRRLREATMPRHARLYLLFHVWLCDQYGVPEAWHRFMTSLKWVVLVGVEMKRLFLEEDLCRQLGQERRRTVFPGHVPSIWLCCRTGSTASIWSGLTITER
jgi:hypothetical protein